MAREPVMTNVTSFPLRSFSVYADRPDASDPRTAEDPFIAQEETDELKRYRKMGGRKRKKTGPRERFLSHFLVTAGLNETVLSQLDNSCFVKGFKKGQVKPPSIEHAYEPKYAKFV